MRKKIITKKTRKNNGGGDGGVGGRGESVRGDAQRKALLTLMAFSL